VPAQSRLLLEAVIDRQVAGQPTVDHLGVWEGHRVGPLPAEGLYEFLCFTVGSGCVGSRGNVPHPQGVAGLCKRFVDVGRGRCRSSPCGTRSPSRLTRRQHG